MKKTVRVLRIIWLIMNQRLIIVLLGVGILAGLLSMTAEDMLSRFYSRATAEIALKEISQIQTGNIHEAATTEYQPQKFLAQLQYTGERMLSELRATVLFFDNAGNTIDMFSAPLQGIEFVQKGEMYDVYIERPSSRDSIKSGQPSPKIVEATSRITLQIESLKVLYEPR